MLLTKGNTNRSSTALKSDTASSVKIRKKKIHKTSEFVFGMRRSVMMMKSIIRTESKAYVRENFFGREIIFGRKKFVYLRHRGPNIKHLFLFGLVKKDALRYVNNNPVKKNKWLSNVVYNMELKPDGREIVGTDIDGAYWQIAYSIGAISENTFNHGIRIDNKMLYLAALSSLGADKRYQVIKDGKITEQIEIIEGDKRLKSLYMRIRYICFSYMAELAKLLGKDFVNYRTDCIYYIKSKKNTKIVTDFFESRGFDYKMVSDFDGILD